MTQFQLPPFESRMRQRSLPRGLLLVATVAVRSPAPHLLRLWSRAPQGRSLIAPVLNGVRNRCLWGQGGAGLEVPRRSLQSTYPYPLQIDGERGKERARATGNVSTGGVAVFAPVGNGIGRKLVWRGRAIGGWERDGLGAQGRSHRKGWNARGRAGKVMAG